MMIPVAPPFAELPAVELVLEVMPPPTLKLYTQEPEHPFLFPFPVTLTNIQSVPALLISLTGEHVAAALVSAGPVVTVPTTLPVIATL